jgi:hypothetical protein
MLFIELHLRLGEESEFLVLEFGLDDSWGDFVGALTVHCLHLGLAGLGSGLSLFVLGLDDGTSCTLVFYGLDFGGFLDAIELSHGENACCGGLSLVGVLSELAHLVLSDNDRHFLALLTLTVTSIISYNQTKI